MQKAFFLSYVLLALQVGCGGDDSGSDSLASESEDAGAKSSGAKSSGSGGSKSAANGSGGSSANKSAPATPHRQDASAADAIGGDDKQGQDAGLETDTAAKVSKPGEYAGYGHKLYDGYVLSSEYVEVRDGTKLAVDSPPYDNLGLPWHPFRAADAQPLVAGEPAELRFDMLPISMLFEAGHKLRLILTFADLTTPQLDPAPTVTVYRDAKHPSTLTLPAITP